MRLIRLMTGLAAGSALLAATHAEAAPAGPPTPTPRLAAAPIADADLAKLSGGEATMPQALSMVLTNQLLTASNSNNLVSAGGNVTSGEVNLGADAFQGFAGIGNFVVNTGYNNNLQGALSVAIDMAPTGAP